MWKDWRWEEGMIRFEWDAWMHGVGDKKDLGMDICWRGV